MLVLNNKYVLKSVAKFSETGLVPTKRKNNSRALTEAAQIEDLDTFTAGLSVSLHIVTRQVGMSHETERKAQKLNEFHQLFDNDFERRN